MTLGILYSPDDPKSPLSPASLEQYTAAGIDTMLETGHIHPWPGSWEDYESISRKSRDSILSNADILFSLNPLKADDIKKIKEGAILVSFFAPFQTEEHLQEIGGHPIQAFSMDMIPRTTLAQSMDVLSSMASLAGYKAVLMAAMELPQYFPMMMTAAGTIKAAKVVVLGAGVAGLQAIATAKRLGAIVEASDVRTSVKEEIESLGAKFILVEGAQDDKDAGGYAVEQSEDFKQRQREEVARRLQQADVVICTAQVRGRKAPVLIPETTVRKMKKGSIIVDLAASTGGNCELTQNEATIIAHGVTIMGYSKLENKASTDASTLLSNNIAHFILHMIQDGQIVIDPDNEILNGAKVYPQSENS